MDDSFRRDLAKKITELKRKLDEWQKRLEELIQYIEWATGQEQTSEPHVRTVRQPRRITCSQVTHSLVVETRYGKHVAWVENHPTRVELGTGKTLRALLLSLADPVVGDDRGDGLVPVKRPWELVPLLRKSGLKSEITGELLRAHVKRLRDAFQNAGLDRGLIETVGEGYRLRLAIENGKVIDRGETV